MSNAYRFGRIEIRPGERLLLVDGERAEVGARAFDLLLALLAHRDRVVTRDELLATVWPGVVVEDSNLQVQVFALRKALGSEAIATVPGRGYQFVLAEDAAPSAPAAPAAAPPATRKPRRVPLKIALPALAAIAVAAALTLFVRSDVTGKAAPTVAPAAQDMSIVVLPFANLTGNPDKNYVADGLTASLTADLSRMPTAFVVDPRTAFSYKGKDASTSQVGRDLGVRFALQGNLQASGDVVRIQVQLADTKTNAQLWTQTFEGDLANLFALQDRVTARVANSIGRHMVTAAARESQTRSGSPRAADLMLRALAISLHARSLEQYKEMEGLHRQVLALDPEHLTAKAGLAMVLRAEAVEFSYRFDAAARAKKIEEAYALALAVHERDPTHWGALHVMATHAKTHGDHATARRLLEQAVALNPRGVGPHNILAVNYLYSGEPRQAIESLKRAMEIGPNPPRPLLMSNMGRAHFMAGDYDEALVWLVKARRAQREPPRILLVFLAMAYAEKGDMQNARSVASELLRHSPDFRAAQFEKPDPTAPAAYKEWFETRFIPSARKAGLPE
jgi:adenylate cyclase